MSEELVMPRLSDTMEEGTIGRWLVHEGDAFAAGDVLAEIETDKATMEFQAYDAGTVLRILVGDGETVALGAPIAIVGAEGETADEAASAGNGATTPPPQEQAAAEPEPKAAPARKPSKSVVKGEGRGRQRNPRHGGAARLADRPPHGRRGRHRPGSHGRPGQRPRGPCRQGRRGAPDLERRADPAGGSRPRPQPPRALRPRVRSAS